MPLKAFCIPAGRDHICHAVLRRLASGRLFNCSVVRSLVQDFSGWQTSSLQVAVNVACSRAGQGLILLMRNVTLPPPDHIPENIFAVLRGRNLTLRSHGGTWRLRVHLIAPCSHWSLLAVASPVTFNISDMVLDISGSWLTSCYLVTVACEAGRLSGRHPETIVYMKNVRTSTGNFEVKETIMTSNYGVHRLFNEHNSGGQIVRCTRGFYLNGHEIRIGMCGTIQVQGDKEPCRKRKLQVLWEGGATTSLEGYYENCIAVESLVSTEDTLFTRKRPLCNSVL